jgi:8-oxo-dGTP pyrophosphatase MutT (NUDIX family)
MRIDLHRVRSALQGRFHNPLSLDAFERHAAVAAILRERDSEAEVLLIRRAKAERDPWSGHMAFPGGRKDPSDQDLLATAIRETFEEVGVELHPERDLLGRLDDLPAIAKGKRVGMLISPFVFAVERDLDLRENRREVEEVLWAKLSPLAGGERDTTWSYDFEGRRIALPAYDVDGRIVWGLTHRMLRSLFDILASGSQ